MEQKTLNPHLLVVDDDPAMGELLSVLLSLEGSQVQRCTSGSRALELLEQRRYDLVLSDLKMPRMNGMELLTQVTERFPRVAFVMLTGNDDVLLGVRAMKAGAADYLIKPFQKRAVISSVRRALEKKSLEMELQLHRHHLEEMVQQRTRQLEIALKRIESTYHETLQALGQALELRDDATAGHSQRVTRYSLEIARAMNCTQEQLKDLARGAYLHDIGKIGIPDAVILKPGALDERERATMETHVRIGYEMVCQVSFLAGAAQIVLAHQERYDGTGYPQGLIGNEIPLGARIFSAADTLDAITSDRPYRRALPYSVARETIAEEAGRQFDPAVVQAFLGISESVWEQIRAEVNGHRHSQTGDPRFVGFVPAYGQELQRAESGHIRFLGNKDDSSLDANIPSPTIG
jgi:putative nucleotidyltransferase with HDIG domain